MTPEEQKEFVRDLSKTITDDICEQIDQGKIPGEWDGIELRYLLMYRHTQSNRMGSDFKGRHRKVRGVIVVNNL